MPTGYTAKIYEGKDESLREFLEHLARGMALYIMQRDEDSSEPPKPREVGEYYERSVKDAEREITELLALTQEQKVDRFIEDQRKAEDSYRESVKRQRKMAARYDQRIRQVEELEWPTDEEGVVGEFFTGYKNFVLSQLTESKKLDASEPYRWGFYDNVDEWYTKNLERAVKSLRHSQESLAEEKERVRQQNLVHNAVMEFLDGVSG